MKRILSVELMRESDRLTMAETVSGRELMYRAGKAVFDVLVSLISGHNVTSNAHSEFLKRISSCKEIPGAGDAKIAVICGSGNNAGDGYVVAGLLHEDGYDCTVIRASNQCSEDGYYYLKRCMEKGVRIIDISDFSKHDFSELDFSEDFSQYDVLIDALLGTGFRSVPRAEMAEIIRAINRSGAYVLSIDINSGLNGDNGTAAESQDDFACVFSDLTISIGEWKPGHFLGIAKDVMKKKINVDIGIAPLESGMSLMEESDFEGAFRARKHASNKSTYGYLALVGGSVQYSGAIRLAAMANAAMRAGAGVVRLAAPSDICHVLMPEILEATLFPLSVDSAPFEYTEHESGKSVVENSVYLKSQAANWETGCLTFVKSEIDALVKNTKVVAFGMGVGISEGAREILKYLLKTYRGILIVDADGLTLLSEMDDEVLKERLCTLVLTPHIKELSRLLHCEVSEIQDAPVEKVREMAQKLNETSNKKSNIKQNKISNIVQNILPNKLSSITPNIPNIMSNKIFLEENPNVKTSEFGDLPAVYPDIVLLKGPTTMVTDGDKVLFVEAGCPGMATAGSGDVLSGILAAVCANISHLDFSSNPSGSSASSGSSSISSLWGVDASRQTNSSFLNRSEHFDSDDLLLGVALSAMIAGRAGELAQAEMGEIAMIASDTVRKIPDALKLLGLSNVRAEEKMNQNQNHNRNQYSIPNRKQEWKRLPFKRVSAVFAWNFLFVVPIIMLLSAIHYAQEGQIYRDNLLIALFFGLLSFILFLPVLRERKFFRKIANITCTQDEELSDESVFAREVQDLQIVFSAFVGYGGRRAFRITGKIKNASGAEITVKTPLYGVGKYISRTNAFQSGDFLNEIRLMAYTAPSLKEGVYYFRIFPRE